MKKTEKTSEVKLDMGTRAQEKVACAGCNKELTVAERHAFKGKKGEDIYFCDDCLTKVNTAFKQETENANVFGGLLLGIVAAVAAGTAWYIFAVITEITIGYLAIGVGWLVGMAVVRGAGGKRGKKLQITAVLLTLMAIVAAELATFFYIGAREIGKEVGQSVPVINLLLVAIFDGTGAGVAVRGALVEALISPVGLLIWGIGLYTAYRIPQPRRLG